MLLCKIRSILYICCFIWYRAYSKIQSKSLPKLGREYYGTSYLEIWAYLDVYSNIAKLYDEDIQSTIILNPINLIESLVCKNKGKSLISYIYSARNEILFFDVNEKIISSYQTLQYDYDKINYVNYFKYSNIYLFSCKNGNIINSITFPDIQKIGSQILKINKLKECSNIADYQIVFLPYDKEFIWITNSLCTDINSHLQKNLDIYYTNYQPPSNGIDSDFFIQQLPLLHQYQ